MNELYHHGILGQKWGVRRFQRPDGSYTAAGKKRYGDLSSAKQIGTRLNDLDKAMSRHYRDAQDNDKALTRTIAKKQKLIEKGKVDSKRYEKLNKRHTELIKKNQFSIDMYNKGRDECLKLVDKAREKGYTVDATSVRRDVTRGRTRALAALFLTAGFLVVPIRTVDGVKYTVTAPKKQ